MERRSSIKSPSDSFPTPRAAFDGTIRTSPLIGRSRIRSCPRVMPAIPTMPTEEGTDVIPTFRVPQMLARALRSVLNQTYPHVRAAVFDNASGDETAAVVSEISRKDPRVSYHAHPENIGAAANFNFGVSRVETPL